MLVHLDQYKFCVCIWHSISVARQRDGEALVIAVEAAAIALTTLARRRPVPGAGQGVRAAAGTTGCCFDGGRAVGAARSPPGPSRPPRAG